MVKNKILTALNAALKITNLFGGGTACPPTDVLEGLPLGTPADSPSGEVGVKVHVVSGGSTPVSVQETPSASTVSTSGSVTAGARSVLFICSADFAGSILGVTRGFGDVITISAQVNNTLGAIAYTRSAGSIDIYKTV